MRILNNFYLLSPNSYLTEKLLIYYTENDRINYIKFLKELNELPEKDNNKNWYYQTLKVKLKQKKIK